MRDFQTLSSVERALTLLSHLGTDGPRSLRELLDLTGLPRSTVLRLLNTLIASGFVVRAQHGRYSVALKLWEIGCSAVQYDDVRANALPVLRKLRDATGETALYAIFNQGYSVYVEKEDGRHPLRTYAAIGTRSPAYATATGKVLLAWQPEAVIASVVQGVEALTKATLVEPDDIWRELTEIRSRGYAINHGEWVCGVWGVAAPIFRGRPEPVAALAVSGPQDRVEPNLSAIIRAVERAAKEASTGK